MSDFVDFGDDMPIVINTASQSSYTTMLKELAETLTTVAVLQSNFQGDNEGKELMDSIVKETAILLKNEILYQRLLQRDVVNEYQREHAHVNVSADSGKNVVSIKKKPDDKTLN